MQTYLQQLDALATTSDTDSVFVFQASRKLSLAETLASEKVLQSFVEEWTSHDDKVSANATILYGQFLVFIVNEKDVRLGGCSKDKLFHCVEQHGKTLDIDFLNRHLLAFYKNNKVETLPYQQVEYALQNKLITSDTLYFNNTVSTLKDLRQNWLIPVSKSWLGQQFSLLV